MIYLSHLRCTSCGKEYAVDEVRYLCPDCAKDYRAGMPLIGVLEVVYDYAALSADARLGSEDIQSFVDCFSAVDPIYYPPLPVGSTPLFEAERLNSEIGIAKMLIKYDGLNPSGSLKDRASFLMVAEANRLGINEIVCASTGNAACSLSAICAAAGKKAVIFTPAKAPAAKLVQIAIHGAELHKVDGTYDDAFARALSYADSPQTLNRNTGYHPYTIEGKKTVGLEIYLQMGRKVPDWIAIPTGDGVILSGVHKAFVDLQRTGLIDRLPRLLSVQAQSSDAITNYWQSGVYLDASAPATIADSISVKTPSNAHGAVKALQESHGASLTVSDDEIRMAQKDFAVLAGVFVEPSSAATFAGARKAKTRGLISESETLVLLATGHGLKDINAVRI